MHPKISRRRVVLGITATGLVAPVLAADPRWLGANAGARELTPFLHGVASGDPLANRVILWTRVTPVSADAVVPVRWRVASDPLMRQVCCSGGVLTDASRDFTVKVDATQLTPGTTYYYQFSALDAHSPVGRTRTLPHDDVDRLRLAVLSCSNYPYGLFNVYGLVARRHDLVAVLHLGDYIYEYANGVYGDGTALGRIPDPNREIVSLADYRARHAIYKTDPDLQECHRQHPFIAVRDDHESANDSWMGGAENHDPDQGEGDWEVRRALSIRAYFEWMPIRGVPSNPIYRRFRFGNLAEVDMLDTRLLGRDMQAASPADVASINDPNRQLLGVEQEAWFFNRLAQSSAHEVPWRLARGGIRRTLGDLARHRESAGGGPDRTALARHQPAHEVHRAQSSRLRAGRCGSRSRAGRVVPRGHDPGGEPDRTVRRGVCDRERCQSPATSHHAERAEDGRAGSGASRGRRPGGICDHVTVSRRCHTFVMSG
jgi:alkaline phosphatase D